MSELRLFVCRTRHEFVSNQHENKYDNCQASLYPARRQIVNFCEEVKAKRDIQVIRQLPTATGSNYKVDFHSEQRFPEAEGRQKYFDGFSSELNQLVLVDPDNGFEPTKSFSNKHLLFSELDRILRQVAGRSVISVFQHFRRKPFERDFQEIRERIHDGLATAVCWHSLMFVLVTRSPSVLAKITELNTAYATKLPVKVIS